MKKNDSLRGYSAKPVKTIQPKKKKKKKQVVNQRGGRTMTTSARPKPKLRR